MADQYKYRQHFFSNSIRKRDQEIQFDGEVVLRRSYDRKINREEGIKKEDHTYHYRSDLNCTDLLMVRVLRVDVQFKYQHKCRQL